MPQIKHNGAEGKTRSVSTKQSTDKHKEGKEFDLGRLARLGFQSLAECLLAVPKEYLDFTQPLDGIGEARVGSRAYLVLRTKSCEAYGEGGMACRWGAWTARRLVLKCQDKFGCRIQVTVFGNTQPWKSIGPGQDIHVLGEISTWEGELQMASPLLVPVTARGRIGAVYAGKRGQVRGEAVGDAVSLAMTDLEAGEIALMRKAWMREREVARISGFESPYELLRALHQPETLEEGHRAIEGARRLTVETMVRRAARARQRVASPRSSISVRREVVKQLIQALPFALTHDQIEAIDAVCSDLRAPYPMLRLISGDVGTGKSVTFLVPAVAAHLAGALVAIQAPSVLVVNQLAKELKEFYPQVPVTVVTSGGKLGDGIHVGTGALANAAKREGRQFDLVITDEQQKFGVAQKTGLIGPDTNALEATATAIPRTLALAQFGQMDVSILREGPVRKQITTRITTPADLERMMKFFAEAFARGVQTAVIYPLVGDEASSTEEEAGVGKRTVLAAAERWERRFPGRVGVLHGRLSDEEKADVIAGMREKRFDVLVSSVVIEVGVTLPSLKAMVIMHPERLGANQIHQLRGRLARKGGYGHLFLHVEGDVGDETMKRLELVRDCSDGFELAERDMDLRGFGDLDEQGNTQTGASSYLFWGIQPTTAEIREAMKRLEL
jgi:ATP-dependent DNA helicase RecG